MTNFSIEIKLQGEIGSINVINKFSPTFYIFLSYNELLA